MNTVKTHQQKNTRKNGNRFKDFPTIKTVLFTKSLIEFHLSDQRIITIPLKWITKLEQATQEQRSDFSIKGHFVFWENVDEIIGVKNLLNGSIVPV
jgi:hypothetical protein